MSARRRTHSGWWKKANTTFIRGRGDDIDELVTDAHEVIRETRIEGPA